MSNRQFLGRGVKFPLQIDPRTGKLAMVSEEEDIREAIGIILRTGHGERVMRPSFGTNAMDYVFSDMSADTVNRIVYDIRNQLLDQERRIKDVDIFCREANGRSGQLVIEIAYTVINTNNRFNHVYPFYVTEGSKGGGAE